MSKLENLSIKLYSDGADLRNIQKLSSNALISGFTTNPTLMKKAGVSNYEKFARAAAEVVEGKSISFEIITDDLTEMAQQARTIASWGENISVKIPVMNTSGTSSYDLIKQLSSEGIPLNITAIFTKEQYENVIDNVNSHCPAIVSIFAGRIADSGRDPSENITGAVEYAQGQDNIEILWASTRETLNIMQANNAGCHIITVPPEMITKAESQFDKDLMDFSRETVEMFYKDALSSNFVI